MKRKYSKWVYIRAAVKWLSYSFAASHVWDATGVDPLEGKYKQVWQYLLDEFYDKDHS